ncbi:FHA domain-containing protein [Actinomyces ruminis]|uniref:FHA domain-containing protein n=1 Tax=Actinomyces ruminis TaxID=1937003 RepID=UPI000B6F78C6
MVPLPERGTVGRDGVLTDHAVSRSHLRVRQTPRGVLLSDAGSANGARVRRRWCWHRLGTRPRAYREGTRLRLGDTVAELRRRPADLHPPQPPTPAQNRWMVLGSALAVLLLGALAVVAVRTGSRGAMGVLAMAPMAMMAALRLLPLLGKGRGGTRAGTAGWRGPRARTPRSRRHAARRGGTVRRRAQPVGAGRQDRRRGGDQAWTGRRRRRTVLRVAAGDQIALAGPGAVGAVRWWGAQVLARGFGQVQAGAASVRVSWGPEGRRSRVSVAAASTGAPARAVSVLPVRGRAPDPGERWWAALRAVAGLPVQEEGGGGAGTDEPPSTVRLEEVCPEIDRGLLRHRWGRAAPAGLPAVLGVGAHGPVTVDLVPDGPHALLAGTTGSGKSELLISWLLQLAVARPPTALSLVLVDYKGGAAFGPLAELPHTAGVLTDLDPAGTRRALASLEARCAAASACWPVTAPKTSPTWTRPMLPREWCWWLTSSPPWRPNTRRCWMRWCGWLPRDVVSEST